MKLNINETKCVGCGLCASVCIRENIEVKPTVKELDSGACFECGHCMAICPTGAVTLKRYENQMERVEKYDATKIPVNTDDLLQLYKQRRSIRWFKNQKIDKDTFNQLFEAAYYSPCAENMQDVEFIVLEDEDKINDFLELTYNIIKVKEEDYYRIKILGEYVRKEREFKYNPLLWEGKQIILGFSKNSMNASIAATRMEILAYTMGLGGFYSFFMMMGDTINHERIMEFFPEIEKNKHLNSAFVIGYPRKKFKKTIPHDEIKVSYL